MSARIFTLIAACLYSVSAYAQDTAPVRFYVGASAAYSANIHSSDFASLPGTFSCSPGFEGGYGSGFSASAHFFLPVREDMRLGLRAGLAELGGRLLRQELIGRTVLDHDAASSQEIHVQHSIASNIGMIFLSPVLMWSPARRWQTEFGLSAGLPGRGDYSQKEEILSPSSLVYSNSMSRTRSESGGSIPGLKRLMLMASLGLGYELPVSKQAVLAPTVRINAPLRNLSSVSWRVFSIEIGASLSFAVRKEQPQILRDTVYIRDTSIRVIAFNEKRQISLLGRKEAIETEAIGERIAEHHVIHEQYLLSEPAGEIPVALRISGRDRDGKPEELPYITVQESGLEEMIPLVPYVFFEKGSARDAGQAHRTAAETAGFGIDSTQLDPVFHYRNLMNIVGRRLSEHPSAAITLTGCNSGTDEAGDTVLSYRRAEAVRDYLLTVWKIDPARVKIHVRNEPRTASNPNEEDGRSENRRVELSSDDDRILEPLVLKSIRRHYSPPVLVMEPIADSAAGPLYWQLGVYQNERKLWGQSGNGTIPALEWTPGSISDIETDIPVTVTLDVADSLQRRGSVSKNIFIRERNIAGQYPGLDTLFRIEKFSLFLFDFNSAAIDPENKRLIQYIKGRIEPDSYVEISGFSDRMGGAGYNRKLSERRCRQVARALGADNARINALGSDAQLHDNGSPEGRMYSRIVQIQITTPLGKVQ